MKIIPKLFIILCFCSCNIANVQSQIVERDLLLVNELDISRSAANNVSVDIKIKSENQRVADSINRNQVNLKKGFTAELSENNALLTLHFSQKFTRRELNTLLAYCGLSLESADLEELQNLLN